MDGYARKQELDSDLGLSLCAGEVTIDVQARKSAAVIGREPSAALRSSKLMLSHFLARVKTPRASG